MTETFEMEPLDGIKNEDLDQSSFEILQEILALIFQMFQ